jgi:hypothetical protein
LNYPIHPSNSLGIAGVHPQDLSNLTATQRELLADRKSWPETLGFEREMVALSNTNGDSQGYDGDAMGFNGDSIDILWILVECMELNGDFMGILYGVFNWISWNLPSVQLDMMVFQG